MTIATTMTAEELLVMPADHLRHELIRGELTTMAPANSEHGAMIIDLTVPLGQYVKKHKLGVVFGAETGFIISRNPDTVRAPDIAFVDKGRIPATGIPAKFWPGAPDLAVEVLSPSDTVFEVEEKVQDWLSAGTRLVWVISPRRKSVTVYRPDQSPQVLLSDETLDGQDVIAGFELPLREIFI